MNPSHTHPKSSRGGWLAAVDGSRSVRGGWWHRVLVTQQWRKGESDSGVRDRLFMRERERERDLA